MKMKENKYKSKVAKNPFCSINKYIGKTSFYSMWYDGRPSFMMGVPHDGLPSFLNHPNPSQPPPAFCWYIIEDGPE
jgi:hypothetical protein